MRLDRPLSCAPDAPAVRASLPPLFGFCRCFLCGHESGIPLPLAADQRNSIECEWCGLDNEIRGAPEEAVIAGRVPTRFF
jgi:hypothetical protein